MPALSDKMGCTYIGASSAYHFHIITSTRIGQNIRRLRERAGLTHDAVAVRLQVRGCDITRSAVAKIEVGQRHLYPDELILLREILGAEYSEILA